MDVTYSSSSVPGYKEHLHVHEVRLPLKYSGNSSPLAPNDSFHQHLARAGAVVQLHHGLINSVVYEISNNSKVITLTPVVSKSNHLGLEFQSLRFELPHSLIANCWDVHYDPSGEEGTLIIDIIDSDYLFLTFRIDLANFVRSQSSLGIHNFASWGNISVPYSFELRSSPYLLKSVDPLNLVVSLKDGGLLHFQRTHPLEDFDVFNFTELPPSLPFNFIGSLFRKNPKSDIVMDGISSNSIVDLIAIDSSTFVTLSVSKVIKLWDLKAHTRSQEPIFLSESLDSGSWLTAVPTKYFHIFESSSGCRYLTLHLNINSSEGSDKSRFGFKTWKISDQLTSVPHLDFEPELPNLLLVTLNHSQDSVEFQNKLWFIQDFQCQVVDHSVKYFILWKSNTSSIVVSYTINIETGATSHINWSHINQNDTYVETAPNHETDYYSNLILNSGIYDTLIVRTSINILREHLNRGPVSPQKSLRSSVYETLELWNDAKTFWFKFYSLCEQYKCLSEETFAIGFISVSSIVSLQSNGLGIYRPSHYYESFLYKRKNTGEGKLASLLLRFQSLLSTKTSYKLCDLIKNTSSKLSASEVTDIFDKYLRPKISDEEINDILTELDALPGGIDIINSIIDSIDYELIDAESNALALSKFDKLNTIHTFKQIKQSHETLLLNLIILFMICEVNEQILLLINKLIAKLNTYNLIGKIFDTSFTDPSSQARIEANNLSNLENSLFWSSIVAKHPQMNQLIQNHKLNEAYDYFYHTVLSKPEVFVVDATIDLINRNEGKFIRNSFLANLNSANSLEKFLIGLVYLIDGEPDEYFNIFADFGLNQESEKYQDLIKNLNQNVHIGKFLDSIFAPHTDLAVKQAQYFHALSELAKSQGKDINRASQSLILENKTKFLGGIPTISGANDLKDAVSASFELEVKFSKISLKFEQKAIDILKSSPASSQLMEYYLNMFELSMTLSEFDLVYESLTYLNPSPQFKKLFTRFIKKLISNNSISVLFPPNTNELYQNNYLLVDSILLELANDELTLSQALKYYEYLYSWRLFGSSNSLSADSLVDKRGAVESLYLFITRFRSEHSSLSVETSVEDVKQYKLKILELYMIILNTLKSFDDDEDKWILKTQDFGFKVTTLDELKIEYYEWLKQLGEELNE